jgi:hypothetical protein
MRVLTVCSCSILFGELIKVKSREGAKWESGLNEWRKEVFKNLRMHMTRRSASGSEKLNDNNRRSSMTVRFASISGVRKLITVDSLY